MIFDESAKHILFITSSRIGDAVLSTGLLKVMQKQCPKAKITIACGSLVVSLFEGFDNIEEIIAIKKYKYNKHWLDLWIKLIGKKFDYIVDLRNSIVSRLLFAKTRYIYGSYIDKKLHKVEQNASVMKLLETPSPYLMFNKDQKSRARELIPEGKPVLAIAPTSNWIGKTWPAERFIEIIKWITKNDGFMPNVCVAIFAAKGEEKVAYQVLSSIPKERQIDVIAKTDPAIAAAAISYCDFYIGNDSGLMHCSAAVGVKTLGLFGPSYPHIYRPWGDNAHYVSTPETFDMLKDFDGYDPKTVGCLMESLTVDMVKSAIESIIPPN